MRKKIVFLVNLGDSNKNKLSLTLKNKPLDLRTRNNGSEFTLKNNYSAKKSFQKLGMNFSPQKTNFSNNIKHNSPLKMNRLEYKSIQENETNFAENNNDEELLETIQQGMAKAAFLTKNQNFEKENLKGILNNQINMERRKDKSSMKLEIHLKKLEKILSNMKNDKNH